jgi:hypothetical protein
VITAKSSVMASSAAMFPAAALNSDSSFLRLQKIRRRQNPVTAMTDAAIADALAATSNG